ncbi:hypothetical protein I4F81_001333 [Pyropia yezoensis]|uniref:Uncharacterized protein n=1 Tax=Pyropia yezoensis TaxID=2788 RepID=A0ACC3BMK0_PYRYE|nr:hypothetical protein I4F81_001333 [Neopyropia yezoensis]
MAAPTPVQAAVIPPALRGTPILACAPTGTGKTAAFVLPLLQRLSADVRSLYALILTPTRELAYQLAQAVGVLGARLPVRVSTLVGGVDGAGQTAALDGGVHVRLKQTYVFLPSALKDVYLCHYLMSPTAPAGTLLVFTTRVATAVYLAALLPAVGVPRVASLHAGLSQADRLAALRALQAGTLRAVVATDVVARGLDLPAVAGVVNYDLPRRPSVYVHRVGRTARAGRRGVAVSFVGERDVALVHAIEAVVGAPLAAAPGFATPDVLAGMGEVVKARALRTRRG